MVCCRAVNCFLLRFQEKCDDIRVSGNSSATQSVTLVAAEAPDADKSGRPGNVLPRCDQGTATQTRIAAEQADAGLGGPFSSQGRSIPESPGCDDSTKTAVAREQSDDAPMIARMTSAIRTAGTQTLTSVKAEAADQDPRTKSNRFLPKNPLSDELGRSER